MTYKYRARLKLEWVLEKPEGEVFALGDALRLLTVVDATGKIADACRACGLSYRHAWGLLRQAEQEFGQPLLLTERRKGTRLTAFGQHLVWANRRVDARLSPSLESMASELQQELEQLKPQSMPRLRLHASHGFAVEALTHMASGFQEPLIELRYRTAAEALASLTRNDCDLAGFQIPEGEHEQDFLSHYGQWLDPSQHQLIYLATRNTGLFVQPGNPRRIHSVADLADPEVRFVNRQIGSSTRLLVGMMLNRLGIPTSRIQGYDTSEFTHMAIAAHIASGMADVGFGVETAARRFKLDFIPIVKERYFFALRRDCLDWPLMSRMLALMQGDDYLRYMSELVGYDGANTGRVMSLEQAFGQGFALLGGSTTKRL